MVLNIIGLLMLTFFYLTFFYVNRCVIAMLRHALSENLTTQKTVLAYMGEIFRVKLNLPPWYTDQDVGEYLIK